jgi:hypothetical protein
MGEAHKRYRLRESEIIQTFRSGGLSRVAVAAMALQADGVRGDAEGDTRIISVHQNVQENVSLLKLYRMHFSPC